MLYNPLIHLALGLSALALGVLLAVGARATAADATHLRRLSSLSVAHLDDPALAQDVVVEGQISPTTPTIYRGFVAYTQEEYRSRLLNDTEHWVESARVTPPVSLRLPDGEITIVNTDYVFPLVTDTVREAAPTVTRGAVRVRGLRPGTPVVAIGTVVTGPHGRGLHATEIYPGTRAEVVAHAQGWSHGERRLGLGAMLRGLAEVGVGSWQLRRFLHDEQTRRPVPPLPQRGRRG
jgi:hypothetical protein